MLAWCVTIHKAQGLTLDRALIDAGSDERAMGQLFVALTRVRHPDHVAFSPMPPLSQRSLHGRRACMIESDTNGTSDYKPHAQLQPLPWAEFGVRGRQEMKKRWKQGS